MPVCFDMKEIITITGLNFHKVDMYDNEKMATKEKKKLLKIFDEVEKSCRRNELIKHLKTKYISKGVQNLLCLLYFVYRILCGKDLNTNIFFK